MKEIVLTQGQVALVDDADFDLVSQLHWIAAYAPNVKGFYAVAHMPKDWHWPTKMVRMSRFILGAHQFQQVDHVNHDTLDNRRENLRLCSNSQNAMSRIGGRKNRYGCRGIVFNGCGWGAQIYLMKNRIWLGTFPIREDAIQARKDAESVIFGEFSNRAA
jgi:hypothetical protein